MLNCCPWQRKYVWIFDPAQCWHCCNEHASISNISIHSLPHKPVKDNDCWWYQWLSALSPWYYPAKFWSLLWLPAHIKGAKWNSSWWMTLGGLWMGTAAQCWDVIPKSLLVTAPLSVTLISSGLLNWTSNESPWPLELTWTPIWRIILWICAFFCTLSQAWSRKKWGEEI